MGSNTVVIGRCSSEPEECKAGKGGAGPCNRSGHPCPKPEGQCYIYDKLSMWALLVALSLGWS